MKNYINLDIKWMIIFSCLLNFGFLEAQPYGGAKIKSIEFYYIPWNSSSVSNLDEYDVLKSRFTLHYVITNYDTIFHFINAMQLIYFNQRDEYSVFDARMVMYLSFEDWDKRLTLIFDRRGEIWYDRQKYVYSNHVLLYVISKYVPCCIHPMYKSLFKDEYSNKPCLDIFLNR